MASLTCSDFKYGFYINLDKRGDRKEHVEAELKKVQLHCQRFPAIEHTRGAIGCTMSHLECLKLAKEKKWPHAVIVEDDIVFTNPTQFLESFEMFLQLHSNWDVLLLGGNVQKPYQKIESCCAAVKKCQTTTGYIVKSHYFDPLIANIEYGLKKQLEANRTLHRFCIDIHWFKLQQKDQWYILLPLTVSQLPGYSNIQKRVVNYQEMLQLP